MMFWQMVTIQQIKLFKRAIFWVEVALLMVGAVALHLFLYTIMRAEGPETVSQMEQALTWPIGLTSAMGFAAGHSLGGLIVIVLAGAVTAQAYTWRTLHLWLSRGVSRPLLMTAKFVALLLPALLVVLASLMAGGATTAVFSQLILGRIPFDQIHWGQLSLSVLRTWYSLLPYAALTLFLAVLGRSTVVAVGGGLTYALLLEGIVVQLLSLAGGTWAQVGRYLPVGLVRSLLATNAGLVIEVGERSTAVSETEFMAPETAALGIALYILTFVGLAILIFQRQDLGE